MLIFSKPGSWFLLVFFAALVAQPLYANGLSLTPASQQALELLNDGKLIEASDQFLNLRKEFPDDPAVLFLYALTRLRIMSLADYSDKDKQEFTEAMDRIETICEPRMEKEDDALFLYSSTQGLRAQLSGIEGDWWATAKHGKRMKSTAQDLVERNPNYFEGYYVLGSYNYFADALPGYIKFFRALAFLPGGDRTEGMKELLRAYENPNVASVEAGRTLACIYTYFENRPEYGVKMCDNVLAHDPDGYDIGLFKGINLYFSSDFVKAEEWLKGVDSGILAYSRSHGSKENEVLPVYLRTDREARYWIARSLMAQKKFDEAEQVLLKLKNPELHQPFWIQRGIFLSLAEIDYRNKRDDAAESLIVRVLSWQDVKDSHDKARLLRKKKGNVAPFEVEFK